MTDPNTTFSDPLRRLELPPEVSLSEAARVLGVDKKTVIRYIRDGLLEWRNIAPPSSSRPTFRVKLESAMQLRTRYTTGSDPGPAGRREPKHRRARSDAHSNTPGYQSRYVKIVRT